MGRVAAPLLGWPGRRVRLRIAHRARPLARLPYDVPFPFIPKLGPSFAVLTGMLSLAYGRALITSRLPKNPSAGSSAAWDYSTRCGASPKRTLITRCLRISRCLGESMRPGSRRG